jgi:serpin B
VGHISKWIAAGRAAVVVAVILGTTMAACSTPIGSTGAGNQTEESSTTTSATAAGQPVQVAMSDLTRLAPAASQAEVLSAAVSIQAFGADLYRQLAGNSGNGNLVFSPSSIETALAMTYAGAAGTTAQEMAATLHFQLQGDALHQAFNALDAALESRSFQEKDQNGKPVGVLIKTANSLWGQKDITFEKLFLDTLAANYGAGIRLMDYKTAAEQARQAINSWVSEQTAGKIPELIPAGALDTLTRLVLVNAIYLDATWMSQFDPSSTQDAPFTTLAGDTVTVRMMHQSSSFRYGKGDGWQAVELPYLGGKVAMLLIVPDEGRFAEVEKELGPPSETAASAAGTTAAGAVIDEAVASLDQGTEVQLGLPKFKFRTQAGLKDALTALGMGVAFTDKADFSGMTTEEPLWISDVIHEAYIAVDEEGTEAAAATAVIIRTASAPVQLVQLTIDRPFIFALRDLDTGALLFLGRVTDPTT